MYVFLMLLSVLSCTNNNEEINDNEETLETSPNILLVIADDMGLDASPGYNIGTTKPNMPNLQSIMNSGIKFNNLWSNPTCSPTRATIITGKYGVRNQVLSPGEVLSTSETSLQSYINTSYSNAVIGKWHLSNNVNHPNTMGVDYFAGFMGGGVPSYYNWNLIINGQTTNSTEYTTTKFTDLAIDWVGQQTKPWFLWLAYNAPHTPFHLPPSDLHFQGDLPSDESSINANPLPYYMAALEALDAEFGRLLSSMSDEEMENTVIIFIGDNGTPIQVSQEYEFRRTKGTIYQGGVNVPMVISGKNVSRINDTEDALINTTDLFATIANISGVSETEINDSKSFKNLLSTSNLTIRDYVYAENEDHTIRNDSYKYINFNNGSEAFYNLNNDALEASNLMDSNLSTNDEAIKNDLTSKLQEIRNK